MYGRKRTKTRQRDRERQKERHKYLKTEELTRRWRLAELILSMDIFSGKSHLRGWLHTQGTGGLISMLSPISLQGKGQTSFSLQDPWSPLASSTECCLPLQVQGRLGDRTPPGIVTGAV